MSGHRLLAYLLFSSLALDPVAARDDFVPLDVVRSGERVLGFAGVGNSKRIVIADQTRIYLRNPMEKRCCFGEDGYLPGGFLTLASPPNSDSQWIGADRRERIESPAEIETLIDLRNRSRFSVARLIRAEGKPNVHSVVCDRFGIATLTGKQTFLALLDVADQPRFHNTLGENVSVQIKSADCTSNGQAIVLLKWGSTDYLWTFDTKDGQARSRILLTTLLPVDLYKNFEIHSLRAAGKDLILLGSYYGGSKDYSDLFVAKLDENYAVKWVNRCGGNRADSGSRVEAVVNGNILVSGKTRSKGESEVDWLVLLNHLGYLVWERTIEKGLASAALIQKDREFRIFFVTHRAVDLYQVTAKLEAPDAWTAFHAKPSTSKPSGKEWQGMYAWTRTRFLLGDSREPNLTCVDANLDEQRSRSEEEFVKVLRDARWVKN